MFKLNRQVALLGAAAAVTLAAATITVGAASAATLLSDSFDSSASAWSKSGGTWAVANGEYQQSNSGSELARAFAGDTSWTNYSLQARVKPLASSASDSFVGLGARTSGSTTFYRLALLTSGRAELQAVNSGSVTVLGGVSKTISTGTWYTLRVDVSGTSVTGFVDGTQIAAGSSSVVAAGRVSLQTFHASASFDDVAVSSSGSDPTPTTTGGTTPTPTPTSSCTPTAGSNVADGWAAANAWGDNGTSGGAGGQTVTVTSEAQFNTYATAATPYIIQVSGTISLSKMTDVGSNKTVVGVGSGSGFTGYGLNIGLAISDSITSPPSNAVHNVILRNLKIAGSADDDINVQMFSHHIWIDHNDLSDPNDGTLDIKRGSSYVTVSWNHAHDADKNMLLGRDDADSAQDTGRLKVTYHHNWFDQTTQRNPRVRYGNPVHVYNNYFYKNSGYGVASTIKAGVLVEGNYFEGVEDPYHLHEGDTSEDGTLVARNNYFVDSGTGITAGSVDAIPYAYTLDTAANVKSIVSAGTGTGKVGAPAGGSGTTCPTATVTVAPTTPVPTTTPPSGGTSSSVVHGYATVSGSTTGGGSAAATTVTSLSALTTAAAGSSAAVIQVNGNFSCSDDVRVASNKTIVGVGSGSGLTGCGLNLKSVSNVIIRNLKISKVLADNGNGDAIHIESSANHIWIDHNDLSSDQTHDKDYYDGLIDITHAADYITVSWNYLHDHFKGSLVGHSDDNASEDTGKFHVTYDHNYFSNINSRGPSLRFGTGHAYNNYYANMSTAVHSRMGAQFLVQNNVFRSVTTPIQTNVDSDVDGYVNQSGNDFGTGTNKISQTGSFTSPPYSFSLDSTSSVLTAVPAGAGTGKI
jgi:pectate lyase